MTSAAPLYVEDLIDIARDVHAQQRDRPVVAMGASARFRYRLEALGHEVDPDLWAACVGMCRATIGSEEGDYLFKFPYPHLVAAGLALVGRSDEGANMERDFADQREVDYGDRSCVPHCQGGCDHSHQIWVAYERAGRAAMWLEQVLTWARPKPQPSTPPEER